jgi:N6-adenosine-specific RNA methylase IME4
VISLLATRGKPKRINAAVHSIKATQIETHCKKADIVRRRILELCGDLKRIELFARTKAENWHVWGNEIVSEIEFLEPKNGLLVEPPEFVPKIERTQTH